MGTQTFDEAASPQKVETELAKFPQQAATGCRVAGLRTFHPSISSSTTRSKQWCRALTPASLPAAFAAWLTCDGELPTPRPVVSSFLSQLRSLRGLFVGQSEFRLYSSSLLLTFDAAHAEVEPRVRMIDFTHVFGAARAQWLRELRGPAPDGLLSAVEEWRGLAAAEESRRETQPASPVDVGYITGLETVIGLLQAVADGSSAVASIDKG